MKERDNTSSKSDVLDTGIIILKPENTENLMELYTGHLDNWFIPLLI